MFNKLFMTTALALPLAFSGAASAQTPAKQPNIVVIMADDVGIWNISAYHRGMMGGSPEPGPDRPGRRPVHGLLRPAILHRGTRRLHPRPDPVPHRSAEGRHA